jgi:hypothetical protein
MLLSIAACQRTRYYHDVKVDGNLGFEFFENNLPVNPDKENVIRFVKI